MNVGIEAINVYAGRTFLDVRTLFQARGLDLERFDNLMMKKKSVGLPCEDPVTNGVNAAKPIIERLSEEEKNSIQLLITSSESGIDFGKSISNYIHDYLGLSRNCRSFEMKQACFAATAALQMASAVIASGVSPGAKALVIATDIARAIDRMTYAEPSGGVGAVAMLVSDNPRMMQLDFGATGLYSFEVMDTCRPQPEIETGDPDISLMAYLDCLENSFKDYNEKVEGVNFQDTFDYLAFHTPFAGMVKGAHRKMMRQLLKYSPDRIEADFVQRVQPSLEYCVQVGNIYSATLYLALASTIDCAALNGSKRVGLFSYGSGCSSEFYSGLISPTSQSLLKEMNITGNLAQRYELSMDEYEHILDLNREWVFGTRDKEVNTRQFSEIYDNHYAGTGLLQMKKIGSDWHREYDWA
jgi:polyketide biosynthesis 3-hydroxy-3-methylglutaryl-CoA synthase-like enzyme PksG